MTGPAHPRALRPEGVITLAQSLGYRKMARQMQKLVIGLALVILVLAGVLWYNVKYGYPQDRYFAQTNAGPRPLMAFDQPYLNRNSLFNWASTAATSILTFGFNDMNRRFEENKQYFTPEGWNSFMAALEQSKFLETVNKNQQLITAIVTEVPELSFYGMSEGRLTWILKLKMSMTIRAGNKKVERNIRVNMAVVQVPTEINPMGIGIHTWFQM